MAIEFVISIPVANDSTRIAEIVRDRSDFLQINDDTGGMNIRISSRTKTSVIVCRLLNGQ